MKKQAKQSKISIKSILCVSILIIGISTFSSMRINATNVSNDPQSYSSLTPHDPIFILSDSNFTDYGFPGSGTAEEPYVIEGYNITTTDDSGIYITDTTKYFIVRNCYVDAKFNGIYLDGVADGTSTVINNTCNNNILHGIRLNYSGSSTIANNTCNSNGVGIELYIFGSSTIANNTCSKNYRGIRLWYSGSSTIANNTCNNNDYGILLEYSGSSTVTNNTCYGNNNWEGIYLTFSESSTVVNNTFTNCGLYINEDTIGAYLSDIVENNWVNGEELGFYTNLDSTIVAEPIYGQLILVNCTNVTVRDQILNNTAIGLYLFSCLYTVIINNTCSKNSVGIWLDYSVNSTVANNLCSNNNFGICFYESSSSTITNNTCSNNNFGIEFETSSSSTVANNTCNNNIYGIMLEYSSSSTVANNTCNNNDRGILLKISDFCVLSYNLLQENEDYGIYLLSDSDNNLIHHNTFVDNSLGGTSQAYDDGSNNDWYDTTTLEGNYWSDWSGTGSYSIDGLVGAIDSYPLDEPVMDINPPLIVDIIHSPSSPTELDSISINATVTDASGVLAVTLTYRVIDEAWWTTHIMTLVSGDVYSATIGSFAAGDTIEYYIVAWDNSSYCNEAINDNSGLFHSFTVSVIIPEFQMFSPLLPTLTFLSLGFGLVVLQRRKR